MDFRLVERDAAAFQRPVTSGDVQAICERVFGPGARVVSAVELSGGMYNSTYRVALAGGGDPVILRIAPESEKQFRSERALMRNEFASLPWLAAISALMPRVLAADWSHEVIGRDYLVQTYLGGVPAPERLGDYPRSAWPDFFRQMGVIARRVHAIRGPWSGPVTGPGHDRWSTALVVSLEEIAADVESVGLNGGDLREAAGWVGGHREVLDEVTEPRMLSGDLWTVNVMLATDAAVPTITGVFDLDRTWWGDPAADWTIRMALAKADEREAFWDSYGPPDRSATAAQRSAVYEARHLGAIRLERHRLGNAEGVKETYGLLGGVLTRLA